MKSRSDSPELMWHPTLIRDVAEGPCYVITRARRHCEMDADDFANALSALSGLLVSRGAIQAWEHGDSEPPGRVLWAALRLAGINPRTLPIPENSAFAANSGDRPDALVVDCHKFVPVYCPPQVIAALQGAETSGDPTEGPVSLPPFGVHLFPFGVAVFHLVERMTFEGIAWLAAWRRASYRSTRMMVDACLAAVARDYDPTLTYARYVFSLINIDRHPWSADHLESALHLVSMPGILLPRTLELNLSVGELQQAHDLERDLIRRRRSPTSDVVPFGIDGIAHGYASWAGLVYNATAADAALGISSLVSMEVLTQALWCYCSHVIENGTSAKVGEQAAFLDIYAAKLLAPSRRETLQNCMAREAIVKTSRIHTMLNQARAVLTMEPV